MFERGNSTKDDRMKKGFIITYDHLEKKKIEHYN